MDSLLLPKRRQDRSSRHNSRSGSRQPSTRGTSDPEFGHHLWAKSGNFELVHVGWSLNGGEGSLSAASKSGRFHGTISVGLFSGARNGLHDIPIVIIFDAKTGVLWPSKNAQNQPLSVWKKAWSEIKENEPRFPPPPDL